MGIVQSLFGGPPPKLQPQGPAPFAQPDARDRQALFWWLKRNTSYTAINHNAELWAKFVDEWEKWLRSMDDPSEHLITTMKYALDSQLYYERGLKRLRVGDRSVFDRKSAEGWLGKVNTALVERRMEWDNRCQLIAEQDGVPLPLLLSYYKAHEAAMAVGQRGTYRGMAPYLGMNFPSRYARPLLAALSFNTALPEARWDVSFAPGKRTPKDGIYEMVNQDGHIVGSLQHFHKSEEASADDFVEFGPDAGNEHATAFLWRLLWEDTRYKDGTIPDEERLYPTPEQSVAATQTAPDPVVLRCEANQPCPQTGFWFTPARTNSRRQFGAGELMPDVGGDYGTTIWQWDEMQR